MAGKDKYGYRESFPRFYKPDSELKAKAGGGGLDPDVVESAQKYLDGVKRDVIPEVQTHLADIESSLTGIGRTVDQREQALGRVARSIMNVKATAGMFGELMLCRVSSQILTFLEDARRLDGGVTEILGAYLKVARTIIQLRITNETDEVGQRLFAELRQACHRYFKAIENEKP